MATNLQPYKTTILKPGYHFMVADNGIEYVCFFALFDYFFKDYPSIASKVFAFNIELFNKEDIDIYTSNRLPEGLWRKIQQCIISA